MTPNIILITLGIYFLFLILIAQLTKGSGDNKAFFTGNRNSKWYLVAFGMIGASLSGVTFLSVPGLVGTQKFAYFQLVLGYLLGYAVIAYFLIPLYYRLNVVSIYEYLETRFGFWTHKTGAAFFLLSRMIGSSSRVFLVAGVLHHFLFANYGFPFILSTIITVLLIWIYTFQGGIKTIVITDTFQTAFMILSLVLSIYFIQQGLNLSFQEIWDKSAASGWNQVFFWDNFMGNKLHFGKQFLGGALIAFVMTGLDQDMMQKNLTCKNAKESQINMMSMSLLLIPINFLFLALGAFLYVYATTMDIAIPERPDYLFPEIALNHFPVYVGITFLLGLIAAAYSSADSALTALTTAFCVDFLGLHKKEEDTKQTRLWVHIAFSVLMILLVWAFDNFGNESILNLIFTFATYTYGPLLGLFSFGLLTKFKVRDEFVLLVCLIAPVLTFYISKHAPAFLGYTFSYELILVNAGLTFLGMLLLIKKENTVYDAQTY